jgi:two-component system phosphate regulon response regulator PhoB
MRIGGEEAAVETRPLVMLIDDDAGITEMYRLGLELEGFRVSIVNDPDRLRVALDQEIPDIFVLDWDLGSITGGDVLDRLKSDPRTAPRPVFMISNHPEATAGGRTERAGALAWLLKSRTTPNRLATRLLEAVPGPEAQPG